MLDFSGTDRYRVIRPLGHGGMGEVYEVEDIVTGTHVALKRLAWKSTEQLLRFKQEFRSVSDLRHPNLIRLYELSIDSHEAFFTMELIQGKDLHQWAIASGPLLSSAPSSVKTENATPMKDPQRLLKILVPIFDALDCLHEMQIIHRDLKPENILIDADNIPKLLDFGVAQNMVQPALPSLENNTIPGTLPFMAPEQLMRAQVSPATDIYALGCTLYLLLTGYYPFSDNLGQILHAHHHHLSPDPELLANAPEVLAQACCWMMERLPEQRPSTTDLRAMLGLAAPVPRPPGRRSRLATSTHLIGRDQDLLEMEEHLEHPSSRTLALTSPTGMGTSTMLHTLAERARRRGLLVLTGRARRGEHMSYRSLDALCDVFASYLATLSEELKQRLQSDILDLCELFPSFSLALVGTAQNWKRASSLPNTKRIVQALHALTRLLRLMARAQPVWLVIDDLQWSDASSLAFLQSLQDAVSDTRVHFLLGADATVLTKRHPLKLFLEALSATPNFLRVCPGPLPEEAVRQHFKELLNEDPQVLNTLVQQTASVPLLVTQVTHFARFESAAAPYDDLLDWFKIWMRRLSGTSLHILEIMTVSEGPCSLRVFRELLRIDAEELREAINELIREQWVHYRPSPRKLHQCAMRCVTRCHTPEQCVRVDETALDWVHPRQQQLACALLPLPRQDRLRCIIELAHNDMLHATL